MLLIASAPLTTMAERRHCAVGKPAGRRFSRAGPGMALRGDPRSNAGERACRALARHRVVGQSLLLPFWRLKKGVAVKAKPQVAVTAAMDMYAGNPFHTGLPVTPRITVAYGSTNASSAERGASLAAFPRRAWERSINVLPPSRAGSLPQGIQVHPSKSGRL